MLPKLLQDLWVYDDPGCQSRAREIWWERSSDLEHLNVIAFEGISREIYIQNLSNILLSFPSRYVKAQGESRKGAFCIENPFNEQWYLFSTIYLDDSDFNPNPFEVTLAVMPFNSGISEHINAWLNLCLFEPISKITL